MISKSAHRCEIVDLITARKKITACNSVFPPASHDAELAEADREWTSAEDVRASVQSAIDAAHDANVARFGYHTDAPFWTDENEPTEAPAYSWPARDGYFDKPRDEFKHLKSQAEIDEEFRGPGIAVWLWMGVTATTAALIMAGFDWLVGAM